ncbi:hypothetical protein PLESTB_000617100 [Pleodorina starrii]|uniref:Uncharacterized protein n=1 Tax=Pleodorina starrii TaxID=330485 RepID=A0A9W6BID6_9CHLO|nr:hypothetical protein PLESTM_001735900 [Pleodorina starrii]GLC52330.1 hypothetical protein PLESTB_000617100 [Pleodorina starrii]GLC67999.1 hypothetical protein PLESTF_000633100 [Pleodorina starrii]
MRANVGLHNHRAAAARRRASHTRSSELMCISDSATAHRFCSSHAGRASFKLRHILAQSSSGAEGVGTATALETSSKPYPYNDSDGKRQKATIEHIFPALESSSSQAQGPSTSGRPAAPWQVGWQMNERNMYWNDDLKVRLIKRIASDELGISDSEMDERLQELGTLLPGLQARLAKAPPKLVARLAANTGEVAQRLLRLKIAFPQANLTHMVNNRLGLLLDDDLGEVEAAAGRLRELLPGINVDRFVEMFPLVLDVECFEMALEDARRIMPGIDVTAMLRANPDMILSLVKGKNMIPYDQISNPWS